MGNLHLVGTTLSTEAKKIDGDIADAYGRSAFNRYYYAAYLTARDLLIKFNPIWDVSHSDVPNLLESTLPALFRKTAMQLQKNNVLSHADEKRISGGNIARACITLISEDHRQKGACRKAGAPSNPPPFGRLDQRRLFSLALPVKSPPPPLFVSFASIDEALEAMPSRYREGVRSAMLPLTESGLPPALSAGVVATLFGVSIPFIKAISKNPKRYYRVSDAPSTSTISDKVRAKLAELQVSESDVASAVDWTRVKSSRV